MKKSVAIVSLDARAGQFYAQQVRDLFGDRVFVTSYSVRDGSVARLKKADLYMVSTDAFESVGDLHQYVPINGEIMEIQVTFLWEVVRQLQQLPAGTRALFVNLSDKMAREAVSRLNQLGVNQLEFEMFYPGCTSPADAAGFDLVITPQEQRYVPAGAKKVMDIGQRVCTASTMTEAALRLGMDELLESPQFRAYQAAVAANTYSYDQMFNRSRRLESQFELLMEILDEGLVGITETGEVFACNKKAEEITKVSCKLALHRRAGEVYPFIPFVECLKAKKPLPARVVRAGGANVNVTVAPVLRGGECIGAFASLQSFNDAEKRQNELRSQLLHKGLRAKYTFADVLGSSPAIQRSVNIVKRMAATDLPILLIGETGTGKELFAHAVHNASPRAAGPFVAINCAAMPENLLESELFGYEDGAFTGARRGGKPGLFEFAHKGTLFLDEVEGMSPALQVKLLRVLQEREIMRVGGNQIICVDVRIVAATNEDLEQRVENGSFRRDLYYRLNTLPALIPPLRERGDDLFLLLDHFRQKSGVDFELSPQVRGLLASHQWRGNIRELRNVVEYFSYTGNQLILPGDLPPTFRYLPRQELPGAARHSRQRRPSRAGGWPRPRGGGCGSPPVRAAPALCRRLPLCGAGARGHSAGGPGRALPPFPAGGAAHSGRSCRRGAGPRQPGAGRHPPHPPRPQRLPAGRPVIPAAFGQSYLNQFPPILLVRFLKPLDALVLALPGTRAFLPNPSFGFCKGFQNIGIPNNFSWIFLTFSYFWHGNCLTIQRQPFHFFETAPHFIQQERQVF